MVKGAHPVSVWVVTLVGFLVLPGLGSAESAAALAARTDYEDLQEWSFSDAAAPLPPEGLRWTLGASTFELTEGRIRRLRPTSAGEVTGFLFEGKGRLEIEVHDPVELRQLRRFMKSDADGFETEFTELVARSGDLSFLDRLGPIASGRYQPDATATDRRDHWLRFRRHDADARVIAALANPGDSYFRADLKTREHDWVTFDFDRRRIEELHLSVFRKRNSVVEHWLGLDVEPDDIAPGAVELEHFDCSVSLLKSGKDAIDAKAGHTKLIGEFSVASQFRAGRSGDWAIRLYLHPMAKVLEVRDSESRSLPFLRDNLGARWKNLDKRLHDIDLVVLLAEPTVAGEALELAFDYELEVANYMPGRSWYPLGEELERGPTNRHTAELRIETRDEFEIRAMGEQIDDAVEGSSRIARWRVEKPAKMITFAITRKMEEHILEVEAGPEVAVFGPPVGDDKLLRMGADIVNSLAYFQELYDETLPEKRLYATLIQAGHGQAFDGFVHLTEESAYRSASRGIVERFLAHEVAHAWWGHLVGWASYRDQWLSEGMAEYAAMMFIEAEVTGGDEIFREIVGAYRDELIGSMSSSMSHFTDPNRIQLARVAQARIGPIALGFRAATAEAPNAYWTQNYRKGALVAHMLRGTLTVQSGSEELFRRVMRGFVDRFADGAASTADLAEEVARHAPGDWSWFFEQWVNRAEIPTYKWSASIGPGPDADGMYPVELVVRREDVSEDFRMFVPVEAEFYKNRTEIVLVDVDEDTESFSLSFAERPSRIVFNPDAAVLAKTEKSKR